MYQLQAGKILALRLVCLALVVGLLFGCKRRDDVAEPVLELNTPSHRALAALDDLTETETAPADEVAPPSAPVPVPAILPPVVRPTLDPAALVERARAYGVSLTVDGASLPGLRIGSMVLARFGATAGEGRLGEALCRRVEPAELFGLGLCRLDAAADVTSLRKEPLAVGDAVVVVPLIGNEAAILEARVATAEAAANAQGMLGLETPFLLLDRAPIADLTGSALLDNQGRLCGVLVGPPAAPLMAALAPVALTRFADPQAVWTPLKAAESKKEAAVAAIQPPVIVPPKASDTLWLGVQVQALTPELARSFNLDAKATGALVTRIQPDSPAQRAGLRDGDLITTLANAPIRSLADLPPVMKMAQAGRPLAVGLWREGGETTLTITPSTRPSD